MHHHDDSASPKRGGESARAMDHHRHHGGHHRFDDAEAWAEQFDDPDRDQWQRPDAVIRWIGLRPTDTVADLGAGTGYFTVRLAAAVPNGVVLANDVEPDMVRYLRQRIHREGLSNVVPVHGTPDDPKLGQPVDVVFLCNVFHHIADPGAFFAKVRERLAPAGRLVIVDFAKEAPEDAPGPPAAMRVSAEEVAATLQTVGFEHSRSSHSLLPYQYILEFRASAAAERADDDAKATRTPDCVPPGERGCRRPGARCCEPLMFVCGAQDRCVPLE